MREAIRNRERLSHIAEAIDEILKAADGLTYDDFIADKLRMAGFIYYIQSIGEAAYMLTKDFVARHPETPWRVIIAMRHHIVHGYFTVNIQSIWQVIQSDLLPLRRQVQRYIEELDSEKQQ